MSVASSPFSLGRCLLGFSEEFYLLIENRFVVIVAVIAFLLVLWFSDGSMFAAFGALAFIAGLGWLVRRLARHQRRAD